MRDVEDLRAERGVIARYETIRQWCRKFGIEYARKLRRRQGRWGDTGYLDGKRPVKPLSRDKLAAFTAPKLSTTWTAEFTRGNDDVRG
jgi:hypothetical protein